jgi:hypothetical protein
MTYYFHNSFFPTTHRLQASSHTMLSLHLGRVGTRRALSVRLALPHPSTSRRYPPFPTYAFAQGARLFVTSPTTRAPTSQSSSSTPTTTRPSILSRFLPSLFSSSTDGSIPTSTSFRKIVALARPERRPILTAIGLLLVSSSVSLSIPFTVGKLIDYFTSANPVSRSSHPPPLDISIYAPSANFSCIPTDDSVWYLADTSRCWPFPRFHNWRRLQCGTRLSHAHVWYVGFNIFPKKPISTSSQVSE